MILPIKHFETCVFYHKHCIEYIKKRTLIRNKNIIDVGGFIGESSLILSKYTDKLVYTFEPVHKNYELLLKTIQLNSLQNKVIPINKGLSNKTDEILINLCDSASSCINTNTDNYGEIETITLDEFIANNPMDIGLIKVDIEGWEPKFLDGARNTIIEQRPILLISIYHNSDDFFL